MLLPQVSGSDKQKSSWEFKLDLKLFSVVRKTERDEDLHQIRKLEKVVDFVRQYGRVGTIDNPDEYVTGSLEMGWRVFDKAAGYQPCVYFGGSTEKTVVGLIGSRRHVIGHSPYSTPSEGNEPVYYSPDEIIQPIYESLVGSGKTRVHKPTNWLHELYSQSLDQGTLATHTVEFLAKRLFHRSMERATDTRSLLIATPLYVSLET